MATEEEWQEARKRFVEYGGSAAEEVAPDLGPLAAEFVGLSRELFSVPPETVVMNAVSTASRPVAIRTSEDRGARAVASTTYQLRSAVAGVAT